MAALRLIQMSVVRGYSTVLLCYALVSLRDQESHKTLVQHVVDVDPRMRLRCTRQKSNTAKPRPPRAQDQVLTEQFRPISPRNAHELLLTTRVIRQIVGDVIHLAVER